MQIITQTSENSFTGEYIHLNPLRADLVDTMQKLDWYRWCGHAVILAVAMIFGLFHSIGCQMHNDFSAVSRTPASQETVGMEKNGASAPRLNGFRTFKATGEELCTDGEGRPVILLFSHATCSHCQWIGDTFDFLVKEYVEKGRIEAHHYDMESMDDLLTMEKETEVPHSHLDIGKRRDPEGYFPYFNFGCRYERFGNGYEESNDLASEFSEMKSVIEVLLKK